VSRKRKAKNMDLVLGKLSCYCGLFRSRSPAADASLR
jgi:hypothetical protein